MPSAFAWSDEPENQQHERYMEYLREHLDLALPHRGELRLIHSTDNALLTVTSHPNLPFDLSGTCTADALVVNQAYLTHQMSELGIFLVIEVKKVYHV